MMLITADFISVGVIANWVTLMASTLASAVFLFSSVDDDSSGRVSIGWMSTNIGPRIQSHNTRVSKLENSS